MSRMHADRQYLQDLHAAVDLAFAIADDEFDTNTDLSKAAKLGESTLSKLRAHITRFPCHLTLVKLCRATGLEISFVRRSIRLSNARKARRA